MEPPFPICPTCGRRFDNAGAYQPKGDPLDVVAYFHTDESCDQVWARTLGNPSDPLAHLGSINDYDTGSLPSLIERSVFVSDLTSDR